jgi:hypothetical protein
MGVGETITVINKSGKVVSSVSTDKGCADKPRTDCPQSKHIVSIFKEAKSAYRERKAEIKAEKEAAYAAKKAAEGVKALRIDDDVQSRASSHRSKRSKAPHGAKTHKSTRPGLERQPPIQQAPLRAGPCRRCTACAQDGDCAKKFEPARPAEVDVDAALQVRAIH